ncbi:MAG: endonuclease/exonuclease/phosphatase family protein [Flavobacteriaceae bacterium]|nr:endonuclease/exonuclease/phosphatase family protein [Flavobacteriaceae bacterium]
MFKFQFLGKLFFGLNMVAALLLFVSFILPFLPPSSFPTLSVLSLAVSPLILLNLLFAGYWLFRWKKRFWVSALVLGFSYFLHTSFFELSSEGDISEYSNSLKVLSYNVRLFNAYEKNPEIEKVQQSIVNLLKEEQPDIVCIQEYYLPNTVDFSMFPYQYIHFKDSSHKLGHAIFSKYPIVSKGAFDFEKTYNNSIFADIQVGADTLRVYNLHLQSLGILPTVDFLQQRGTEKIKKRISQTFVQQQQQVSTILKHKQTSPHPVIFAGDFNNTAFSYIYKQLKEDMNDTFQERGNGLGTSFYFNKYPMRIDFILASETLEVIDFNNRKESFSDHYPIISTLAW